MIVAAGLILAFILIAIFSRRDMRACRWREFPQSETESRWTCVQCGASTQGRRGKRPDACLKPSG